MQRQLGRKERVVVAIGAFAVLAAIAYALLPFSITYGINTGKGVLSFVGPIEVTAHCGSAIVASIHNDVAECRYAARSRLFTAGVLLFLIAAGTAIVIKLVLPALPKNP